MRSTSYRTLSLFGIALTASTLVAGERPVTHIAAELSGYVSITTTGEAGETNTLQAASSPTNTAWDTVGAVVADGAGLMQWTVSSTNSDARYFRLLDSSPFLTGVVRDSVDPSGQPITNAGISLLQANG